MPVWIGQQGYIGRVADWFGNYSTDHGLEAPLWLRPRAQDQERTYALHGVRSVTGVDASVARVKGDNGM